MGSNIRPLDVVGGAFLVIVFAGWFVALGRGANVLLTSVVVGAVCAPVLLMFRRRDERRAGAEQDEFIARLREQHDRPNEPR